MKFKKVEIQAFRAYDKAEDGTFDFQLKDKRNADFISIYAPNGFGKTSFYDAVEWGYTSNIHRFLRKYKFNQDSSKSQKNINSEEGAPEHKSKYQILRNHNADSATQGYVKLFTTNSDKPTVRNIPIPRSGMADYKFDSKETENDYFQKVILSQEWIDAFLKEDDAGERYKTFISYFGNQQLDKYYTSIVSLIKAADAKIKQLTTDLKGVQKEILFNGDQEILHKVNEKIKELRATYKDLNLIDSDFTETDFVRYDSRLIELQHDLIFQLNKNNGIQDVIKLAFQGDEEVLGLDKYESNQANLAELRRQYDSYVKQLEGFDSLIKLNGDLNKLLEQIRENQQLQVQAKEIEQIFPKFEQTQKEVDLEQSNLGKAANELEITENQIADAENAILKSSEEEKNKLNQIAASEKLKNNAQTHQQKIQQDQPEETKLLAQKDEKDNALNKLNSKIHASEQHLNRIESVLSNLLNYKYPNSEEGQYAKFAQRIVEAEAKQKQLQQTENQIKELDTQIGQRQSFNSELEKFVALGAEIADRTQASECPLCCHDFKTYSELANSISSNTVLTKELQDLLQQRSKLQQQQTKVQEEINLLHSSIEKDFRAELEDSSKELKKQLADRSEVQQELGNLEKSLAALNQTKLTLNNLLSDKTLADYLKELDTQIGIQNKELTIARNNSELNKKRSGEAKEKLETLKKQIELFFQRQQELAQRPDYIRVREYFNQYLDTATPSLEALGSYLKETGALKQSLEAEQNEKAQLVRKIYDQLTGLNRADVDNQMRLAKSALTQSQQSINAYESFLMREFSYFPDESIGARTFLLDYDKSIKGNIEKDQKTRVDVQVLTDQLKAVLPFLKYQQSMKVEIDIREQLAFIRDTVKKRLNIEKNKVAAHLDKEIGSFFYQDLINDLYEKIDPHPTYRKIRFLCDFKEDKPKLNVCVVGDSGEEMLIPNLYFSTAQLNILSLSIFLAKALNVTDTNGKQVDCIFIDDPIQSMDSINILSTIDLLRSLVVNNKKQIILSTHDENFHNLLQKKLPTDLFDSKYIELETFGKVKRNATAEEPGAK